MKMMTEVTSTELPWWLSGKEFTCQCRRSEFKKIPHGVEQLSPGAPTTEPVF